MHDHDDGMCSDGIQECSEQRKSEEHERIVYIVAKLKKY